MSIKKHIDKLQKGQGAVQSAKQVAGKLGGGISGTAGLIPGGGFTGGQRLAERSAGGQNAATKALEKVGQMLMGGRDPNGLQFTLTAGGLLPQTFVVTDFTLNESFSQPYWIAPPH
ncbi:putative Type VI secretion system Vgr family protein (fragment) (fragment) [Xenorhabdus nematophila str. Websteri]